MVRIHAGEPSLGINSLEDGCRIFVRILYPRLGAARSKRLPLLCEPQRAWIPDSNPCSITESVFGAPQLRPTSRLRPEIHLPSQVWRTSGRPAFAQARHLCTALRLPNPCRLPFVLPWSGRSSASPVSNRSGPQRIPVTRMDKSAQCGRSFTDSPLSGRLFLSRELIRPCGQR